MKNLVLKSLLAGVLLSASSAVAGSWAMNWHRVFRSDFSTGTPTVFTNQSATTIYLVGAYMSTTQGAGQITAATNRWIEVAVGNYGTNRVFATNLTAGATYIEFPYAFPVPTGTTFSVFMFSPGTNDHVDLATGVNKVWN